MSLVAPSVEGSLAWLEKAKISFINTTFTDLYAEATATMAGGLGHFGQGSFVDVVDSSFDNIRSVGLNCKIKGAGLHMKSDAVATVTRTQVSNLYASADDTVQGGFIYNTGTSSSILSELRVDGVVLASGLAIEGGLVYLSSQASTGLKHLQMSGGSTFKNIEMYSGASAAKGGVVYAQSATVDIRGYTHKANRTLPS